MIKKFEFYHGPVLARLVHNAPYPITIRTYPTSSNASYVINMNIGLYIKHSSSRMPPWEFSFLKAHQDEILEMKNKLERVFIAFVCGDNGIACLSFDELKSVLDNEHKENEWVRLSRHRREKFQVSGTDGVLKHKIGENEFPNKLFQLN